MIVPDIHCAHDSMVKIEELRENPRNPNSHPERQIELLGKIIREQGWRAPITVSNRSGYIVRGHGRLQAAQWLGLKTVPVDRQDYESDEAELADLIADNRIAELAIIDDEMLVNLIGELGLEEIDMELTGFDVDGMTDFVGNWEREKKRTEAANHPPEKEIPASVSLLEKWKVKTGDVWTLGDHRLICGDYLDRKWGNFLIWDPPWDAGLECPCSPALVFADGRRIGEAIAIHGPPSWLFAWDCVSSWYTPNRPLKRVKYCASYMPMDKFNFNGAHYGDAGEPRTVWNTRGKYEFVPDPRGKHLSDVFQFPITKREGLHPHAKPLDWMRLLIGDCIPPDTIQDPCSGSGTSLIACEQLGYNWIGGEIDLGYCSVVLERWSKYTGRVPVLQK